MKVYCKRTYFNDDDSVRWSRNTYYEFIIPDKYPIIVGIYYYIKDAIGADHPITKQNFDKYFIDIDELRNNKINEILIR